MPADSQSPRSEKEARILEGTRRLLGAPNGASAEDLHAGLSRMVEDAVHVNGRGYEPISTTSSGGVTGGSR